MKKVGIILPPEFRRLPAMFGGLYRWFEASQNGILPKPKVIFGSSSGAIVGAHCLPWTEEAFAKAGRLIKNLKTSDIFSLPLNIETELLLLAVPYLLFFLDFKNLSKKSRFALHSTELATSLALSLFLFKQFTKQPSLFSTKPLLELLKNNLDFDAIFESDIRLEIAATDIGSGEEVIFDNRDPRNHDPNRFADIIRASSRLPGRFSPISLDGRVLGDGGILGFAPLQRAARLECDVLVMFLFTPLREHRRLPGNFIEDMVSAAYITEMLVTRMQIDSYLADIARGVKLPTLHIIEADKPLIELTFKNFTRETLVESMNLGYEAVAKDIQMLQKLVA